MSFKFIAKPLNLDRYLGIVQNRVARVGIELEGGWNSRETPPGFRPEHDGSVFKDKGARYLAEKGIDLIGEAPSPIMLPIQAASFIRKFYPRFVDETCGLHIHMSFDNLKLYTQLMVPEFPITVIEYLKRFATAEKLPESNTLWSRLADQSIFCQHKFWPDLQVRLSKKGTQEYYNQTREGNRYTVINYCYKLHGTIECRVLPMFDTAEQSIRAIQTIMDVTNASLVVLAKRSEKLKAEVVSLSEDCEERYESRI